MTKLTQVDYMKIALELAKQGGRFVRPNPMVGAVIVQDHQVIGSGYHEYYGGLHAERNALKSCNKSPKGATMYITLEPCCHQGKTPPCTQAIVESGIIQVVVGVRDPNPLISGQGNELLRQHGIDVVEGVMEQECRQLNAVFFHYITTQMPYVMMKYAMTLDGKIATYTGNSRWITGKQARAAVHQSRHEYMAVMVGVATVLQDDPSLDCRANIENPQQPIRIICDTMLRTPLVSKVVKSANQKGYRTIIATACTDAQQFDDYQKAGCEILQVDQQNNTLNLVTLMKQLASKHIDSILLEGGGTLNWSMLQQGLVQKIQAYIAPKFFGGIEAKTPLEGLGVEFPSEAYTLTKLNYTMLGEDLLIEGEVASCLQAL